MATLSYKAYLLEEGKPRSWAATETRRFGIDADVAMNFVYLREKLQSIFPDLRGKNFTVTWKDDENEPITISTNEELEIALEEMAKNNIYKLYIRPYVNEDRDMPNIEKILHPGVICDVCEKNIHGFRFKCMECLDYDLCSECMILGNHHDHYLVRMTQPIDWSTRDGRRLAHHIRKFMKKTQHIKDDERRCPHSRSSKRSGCPFNVTSGKVAPFDPSIVNSLADFLIDMCTAPSDENHGEQKRSKEQYRDPSAETATEATEDPQEATRHSFSQLLKIVEDNLSNISQFLDPLGINVTVMTDKDSTRNKPAEAKASTQKPESGASTSEDSAKKFPGEGKKLNETTNTTNEKATPSTSDATSTQKEPQTAASAEQAAEAEEWTIVQPQSENLSRTSSTSSASNEATQITPSAPASVAEPEKTEPPRKQNIYPPLPKEVKNEFYHPNPKIQQAVTAMMAMGFSNEGGWLTHLLVSKDGDIGKALDVLHPVRHH
ncbi:sequestosome-1 isoform X2 [Anoplolepis gracilipes]|uniref:sequestosome-1 isoform X2 n=1 Tax=Anoplolepis gracilipes TaxID=354296 RepID=UPI003BA2661D